MASEGEASAALRFGGGEGGLSEGFGEAVVTFGFVVPEPLGRPRMAMAFAIARRGARIAIARIAFTMVREARARARAQTLRGALFP